METLHQAQILYMPYQTKYGKDLKDVDDPNVIAFHVRLWAVKHLNAIHHGLMEPTEEVVMRLHSFNKSLKGLGHKELPLDFLYSSSDLKNKI